MLGKSKISKVRCRRSVVIHGGSGWLTANGELPLEVDIQVSWIRHRLLLPSSQPCVLCKRNEEACGIRGWIWMEPRLGHYWVVGLGFSSSARLCPGLSVLQRIVRILAAVILTLPAVDHCRAELGASQIRQRLQLLCAVGEVACCSLAADALEVECAHLGLVEHLATRLPRPLRPCRGHCPEALLCSFFQEPQLHVDPPSVCAAQGGWLGRRDQMLP
mmetsp:Transcript_66270/g.167961  ORF Transcript_66270/g.167961 Transcript_66270/m.167961 type:complete len:217 (+) Transcript_66270:1573-2223(+)